MNKPRHIGRYLVLILATAFGGMSWSRVAAAQSSDAMAAALREAQLASPAVTFISAESTATTGIPITNRITRHVPSKTPYLEVWSMRQRQSVTEGDDPDYWSHVAIIVDHSKQPAVATFFEFEPKPVVGGTPKPITPRVACLTCHPNGARAIRPKDGTLPLSLAAKQQIKAWNDSIARDGVVKPHMPSDPVQAAALTFEPPGSSAPLELPACVSCHDDATGVRGSLSRVHGTSIAFLVEGDAMPLVMKETQPLTVGEKACLKQWLAGGQCQPTDAPRSPGSLGMTAPHGAIELTATIRTNLGNTITATGVRAVPSDGHASWGIDLSAVTTGNVWRDRHLQQWLKAAKARTAVLKLTGKSDGDSHAASHAATLTWAGVRKDLTITTRCEKVASSRLTCTLTGVSLSLTEFGLTPPHMLAVRVLPRIEVAGTFTLDRHDVTARSHHRSAASH